MRLIRNTVPANQVQSPLQPSNMPSFLYCAFLLLTADSAPVVTQTAIRPSREGGSGHWIERRCSAMGTGLRIEVQAPTRALALAASERALRAIEACEKRLSTWGENPQGELARLNRAPVGMVLPLSEALALELGQALHWSRETDGMFNPAVGSLVAAWDLRGTGQRPSAARLRAARNCSSLADLELQGSHATRHSAGLILEEGGFGKGAGLDAALAALADTRMTAVRMDLGGQWLVATGAGAERPSPTFFAVAHPRHREQSVLRLSMTTGSVATSGNSERGIVVQGQHLGHLLDPSTGQPAPDFGSLTVLASTGLAADALSTGLYVMGPLKALEWCSQREGIEVLALVVTSDGLKALASPGLKGRIQACLPGLRVEFPVFSKPVH